LGLFFFFGRELPDARTFVTSAILPLSHSRYWFLCCYVGLYFISPFLNTAINSLSKKQYLSTIVLFSIVNLYYGYFWKNEYFNVDGFTIAHFVYLYIIAGYFRRFVSFFMIKSQRYLWLSIYLICSVIYAVLSITGMNLYVPHWDGWKYNNPLLIISALSFLLLFLTFNFKSHFVNHLAKSCLALYMFCLCPNETVGDWIHYIAGGVFAIEIALIPVFALVIMLAIIIIDQLRIFAITPLLRKCPSLPLPL